MSPKCQKELHVQNLRHVAFRTEHPVKHRNIIQIPQLLFEYLDYYSNTPNYYSNTPTIIEAL